VLEGAQRPEFLTLLRTTIASSEAQPERVADYLLGRGDVKSVGILGLSYTGNVKVSALSPTLTLVRRLAEAGIAVAVNDPHFTPEEIHSITGVGTFDFPDGMEDFDTVIVVAGHREYEAASHSDVIKALPNARLVLDNAALWSEVPLEKYGIDYKLAGGPNWLGTLKGSSNGSKKASRNGEHA
jgi:UDP-N-acetyl-D-mannosaminuronate dehydrogenase